jgi:4-hydroxy-tetrahydrodipicolinate synthase
MPADPIHRDTRGVYIISATPFDDDGALDLESTDRLMDFYLGHGVSGMTVLGIMGEAPKLAPDEALAFLDRVFARVAGRVPVIVGVSAGGFEVMRRLAHAAMEKGAAGVMVAPPAGTNTEAKLIAYYAGVCAALGPDVPVCVQDFPQATGVAMSAGTILRLAREHAQIVMLKHEDWPGLAKITAIREAERAAEQPRLSILCGNGGLFLPQELARGADGAMTGFAYPEMLVEVVGAHHAGEPDRAEDVFDAYLPLVRYEQQPGVGLAARKEILRRRGAIASAGTRAPGPALTAADAAELTRLVARLERRLGETD